MRLTKKEQEEITQVYDTWLNSYLSGDVETYDSFFDDRYHFIGSTENEQYLDRKETAKFLEDTADQLSGKVEIKNNKRILEKFEGLIFVTELFDSYFLIENEWTYYGKFRFTSALKKNKEGWRFIYQHFSTPDTKAEEGETIGTEKIAAENLMLREAVKRRTVELEQKNRELEIESALERVRARTMAMQKSEELPQAANLLFQQVQSLGMPAWSAGYCLWDEDKKAITLFMSSEGVIQPALRMPLTEDPSLIHFKEAYERGESFYVEELGGEALKQHYEYLRTLPGVKESLEDIERAGFPVPTFQIFHVPYFSKGFLLFITYEPVPKAHEIFKRFASVFEQTYTRFLDLKKAEEQAREAQIEAALERIRNRALIMKDSSELNEVVSVFFNEFSQLDLLPPEARTYFCHIDTNKNEAEVWMTYTNGEVMSSSHFTPLTKSASMKKYYEAWKRKDPICIRAYKGENLDSYISFVSSLPHVKKDKDYKKLFKNPPKQIFMTDANFLQGNIGIMSFDPLSEEALEVLQRFAKVFEFTYTRFLDLKKAEAQAREAQIEAALERVRARTMAMQQSKELTDAAALVFQQIEELGIHQWGNAFQLWDEEMKSVNSWTATSGVESLKSIIPATEDPIMINILNAAKQGEDLYVEAMGGKALENHYKYLTQLPVLKEVFERLAEDGIHPPKYQVFHAAYFSHGYILFITHEENPAAHNIFKRFAKIFEQTYTRFLDLQKAEAQAREAEIQLALERVRARTMAMQQSDELSDAAFLLAQQVRDLGIKAWGCAFHIYAEDKKGDYEWFSNEEGYLPFYKTPRERIFKQYYEKRESGESLFVKEFKGKTCTNHYKYLLSLPVVGEVLQNLQDSGIPLPKAQIDHVAYFNHGYLLFITYEPVPEAYDIFKRLAGEFEQTYTRFLDLQKAEAQAREAQIEAALERVRAASMAMHKSEELQMVVTVVFEQLQQLDFALDGAAFVATNFENFKSSDFWMEDKVTNHASCFKLPYYDAPSINDIYEAKAKSKDFISKIYGKEKNIWFEYAFENTDLKIVPEDRKKWILQQTHLTQAFAIAKNSMIGIHAHHAKTLSKSEIDILKRFSMVFEQGYTRFLDLQKAEAQAREAEIEASLERIRSRTMGMQSSDELAEVGSLVFQQMKELGIQAVSSWFWFIDLDKDEIEIWTTHDVQLSKPVKVKAKDYWTFKKELEAWKRKEPFYKLKLPQDDFVRILKEIFGIKIKRQKGLQHIHLLQTYHKFGFLGLGTRTEATKEEMEISARFAKVFEQTYTRFLDMKKAESQALEAQIEASLERVRARSMAMHNSEELLDVAQQLYKELENLGVPQYMTGFVEVDKINQKQKVWVTAPNGERIESFFLPLKGDSILKTRYNSWIKQEPIFYQKVSGDTLIKHLSYVAKHYESAEAVEIGNQFPDTIIFYCGNFSEGYLHILSEVKLDKEQESILHKFTKVFSITYRRFLDLKLAEEQAREAQIEAGLERVRASTMAMHRSEQLSETAMVLFDQFYDLGQVPDRISIAIFNPSKKCFEFRATDQSGSQLSNSYYATIEESTTISKIYKAWKNKEKSTVIKLTGQPLKRWIRFVKEEMKLQVDEKNIKGQRIHYAAFFSHGFLLYTSNTFMESEFINLLIRFTGVFDQTYTRFLDLKKAEMQAREAKVEAALERVRARTMAMHKGDELADTALLLFDQITGLGIKPRSCGFLIMNDEAKTMEDWSANLDDKGKASIVVGTLKYNQHPIISEVVATWKRGDPYFIGDIHGEDLQKYYQMITLKESTSKAIKEKVLANTTSEYTNSFNFSYGMMYVLTPEPINEVEINTLLRFAGVFRLTYRRFLDLQKAEKQAYEAVKQASIDRVRGEIASMRTSNDLERITPLIWAELINLNVPFIRCGVFIMDEDNRIIHNYLSTPDGKAIAAFHLPYDSPGFVNKVLSHWKKKEIYLEHWDKKAMTDFANILVEQGIFPSPDQYLRELPKEGFYLHLLPFQQGMLYVGNMTQLGKDELNLLQSLAMAFSTAYARYDDFNKLELAKKQVDQTLVDLKQAQQQLIQSEKMASLGELTAGIAHEIQNPLNFVNNFSEVNKELLGELEEAILNGDYEEVKAIAKDIIVNQDKINHHGKRAEGIVKGMLQHSRSSSGQKELTDINSLCDEYVRLAYHGFRAKDKTFNANFKINLDENLPKININAQDVSRVILNLINNAFYAVSQKSKKDVKEYAPEVIVTTIRKGDQVEIKVKDNGSGIPKDSLDKIFQPFFTTKPTGEGTGLGLSISYDIITKGHDGQLNVETKAMKGTEFIIKLPIN